MRYSPAARGATTLLALATLVASSPAHSSATAAPGQGTSALRSGPMLGYSQMREVAIWVQTRFAAEVQVVYWPIDRPGEPGATIPVRTERRYAFTATLRAEDLEPGQRYEYRVLVDGKRVPLPYPTRFQTQELWHWRHDPPPFTLAVASCFYVNEPQYDRPGDPYGAEFQILDHLASRQPQAMVWLGDNTYLREADWHSRSGILHRYGHTRAYPGLQPLLASMHHYATWDDHDFGPDNSDRGYWAKSHTLEVFKLFWPNPGYGMPEFDGVATTFEWADALFVLLDNRYHRSPNRRDTGRTTMFGAPQLRWLIDVLDSSDAPFKFVVMGGQFLNPHEGFETHATYPQEHAWLLDTLAAERIPGVVFLTGDRHRTELSRLDRPGLYPLYDVTVSPLTAGPYTDETEPNELRVDGTLVQERNFALLGVAGTRTDRVLTVTVIDKDGAERWQREIRARDLRPPR